MASGRLPKFSVIKSNFYLGAGNAYYKAGDSVLLGEDNVFSTLVKIEAERATDDKYVNLRFCSSNRYWQKNANDDFVVAVSKKPEEDTSKSSCTLFEAVEVDAENMLFYLTHVQSGGRVLVDSPTMGLYIEKNYKDDQGYLRVVDWDTLVKLPRHVSFRGDNGKYLQSYLENGFNFIKFKGEDPNDELCGFEITSMSDGYIQIKSDHFGMLWRSSFWDWIWANESDPTNKYTFFWPVKIDNGTIALRHEYLMPNFCQRASDDEYQDCLSESASTMTKETHLQVRELVSSRKIYNVRYRMEDARIYGETPYVGGTTTVTNYGDDEALMSVEITYLNTMSCSFTSSFSLTIGITNTFQVGVPLIAEDSVELSVEASTAFAWGTTIDRSSSVGVTNSVPVPKKSVATVSYVGTMGTCDVPFSYTYQDTSSVDGKITENDQVDGVYTGINCYNFSFVIEHSHPLA